jgi:hypothetical protein
MKRTGLLALAFLMASGLGPAGRAAEQGAPLEAVPYWNVTITDGFWSPRLDVNRRVTLRTAFAKVEEAGNLANFRIAAGREAGVARGSQAYDSDVYKIVEAAAYCLRTDPDPELGALVDRVIDTVVAAQAPDGYLNTYVILRSPGAKWQMVPTEHELYCAGHLFEAGVAYAEATGKRTLLDVARRLADDVDGVFGPGKRYEVPGHQEIELALVRLFRATGDPRYFHLAKFFLDERGFAHGMEHRLPTQEELSRQNTVDPRDPRSVWSTRTYRQDHLPVVQQDEAVGHAVRAGYMYAAMTDVAARTGDPGYLGAVRRLWDDVTGTKLYLTGGVGSAQRADEGFGSHYGLPNESAYAETCATVANILWNHRMNLLEADAKYVDVLELGLYNGLLSGVSLSGDRFFYRNPLASRGDDRRDVWSDPACCPTNLVRLIPQLGTFIYARGAEGIFVNLFAGSSASIPWDGAFVHLTQTTRYPWEGHVTLRVDPAGPRAFGINVRVPSWTGDGPVGTDLYHFAALARGAQAGVTVTVNGAPVPLEIKSGYARIRRVWATGDVLDVEFPMVVRRVHAHPNVAVDRGRVALMRGPIVYCLEGEDNPFDLSRFSLPETAPLAATYRGSLLGGVTVLRGQGLARWGSVTFQAVPYYAWANRRPGAMAVWIPETARPRPSGRSGQKESS